MSRAVPLLCSLWLASACAAASVPQAWIDQAREAHLAADAGSVDALERLVGLVDTPPPESIAPADARIVVQDACFRLAHLSLGEGDATKAETWADRGLSEGRQDDLFTANLLVARGAAREALENAAGAAEDYVDALRINAHLLELALAEGSP